MDDLPRRVFYSVAVLVAIVFLYAVVYDFGMGAVEGEPVSFLHALQVVVESVTTTGHGSDAPWTTPSMNLFVILMDLTGVALIFLALPVLVFPLLEEALSTTVPREADVRARTGCTVVAVERDGDLTTDLGPDYRVREDDQLIAAGTDEGTNRFTELLC